MSLLEKCLRIVEERLQSENFSLVLVLIFLSIITGFSHDYFKTRPINRENVEKRKVLETGIKWTEYAAIAAVVSLIFINILQK